jgi:hypothetical protein
LLGEYPAPESDKGALKSEVERLRQRCAALEKTLQLTAPDSAADVLNQLDRGDSATCSTPPTLYPDLNSPEHDEASDGRLLCDEYGTTRYLGGTSGATFLEHLKHFITFTLLPMTTHEDPERGSAFESSIGQYQTYDSRPLPNPDGKTIEHARLLRETLAVDVICSRCTVATLETGNVRHASTASRLHPRRQWTLRVRRDLLVSNSYTFVFAFLVFADLVFTS